MCDRYLLIAKIKWEIFFYEKQNVHLLSFAKKLSSVSLCKSFIKIHKSLLLIIRINNYCVQKWFVITHKCFCLSELFIIIFYHFLSLFQGDLAKKKIYPTLWFVYLCRVMFTSGWHLATSRSLKKNAIILKLSREKIEKKKKSNVNTKKIASAYKLEDVFFSYFWSFDIKKRNF